MISSFPKARPQDGTFLMNAWMRICTVTNTNIMQGLGFGVWGYGMRENPDRGDPSLPNRKASSNHPEKNHREQFPRDVSTSLSWQLLSTREEEEDSRTSKLFMRESHVSILWCHTEVSLEA